MKERAIITPVLIRQVQLMLAGGATGKEAAEITGTSEGTISRIKKAGFDYDTFVKNTEARRKPPRENLWPVEFIRQEMEKQEPEKLELQGGVDYQVQVNEQLAGQMKMDLPEEKTELSDTVKMMRFLGGKLGTIEGKIEFLNVTAGMINENLGKIYDYLGQILRVIGPEGGRSGK